MTHHSANSLLTAIDARHPGMKLAKKHLLLFFVQGHHLAHFDEPLFDEPILAFNRGVTVPDAAGGAADQIDSEGPLNTIGYVLERYSNLSPADLRTLIQTSRPWLDAVGSQGNGVIDLGALRVWFLRDNETNDPDDERPNRAERAMVDQIWKSRQTS